MANRPYQLPPTPSGDREIPVVTKSLIYIIMENVFGKSLVTKTVTIVGYKKIIAKADGKKYFLALIKVGKEHYEKLMTNKPVIGDAIATVGDKYVNIY